MTARAEAEERASPPERRPELDALRLLVVVGLVFFPRLGVPLVFATVVLNPLPQRSAAWCSPWPRTNCWSGARG
jgi:hypothetical protein